MPTACRGSKPGPPSRFLASRFRRGFPCPRVTPMTPELLFEATGDLYLRLIRPDVRDSEFDLTLRELKKVSSACDGKLALQLIRAGDWRERLLGFALTALLKDYSLSVDIAETFADPRGLAIVPAGAYLIAHHACSRATFPIIDIARFNPDLFDGELGWTLDRVRAAIHDHPSGIDDSSPNSAQDLGAHVDLYQRLLAC